MVRNPKATNGKKWLAKPRVTNGKKWLEDKKSTEVINNGKIVNNRDHR